MTVFLPTCEALLDLARLLELEPNHPAVAAAFDRLVLSGDLKPFVPDWWQLSPELATGVLPGR